MQVDYGWKEWVGTRFSEKNLLGPDTTEQEDIRNKRWPKRRKNQYRARLLNLLLLGAKLDPKDPVAVDDVNQWMRAAWGFLSEHVLGGDGHRFFLKREEMTFSLMRNGYICPITQKILDTTFKGYTPYLPAVIRFAELDDNQRARWQAKPVELPNLVDFSIRYEDYSAGVQRIRHLINNDDKVKELRSQNLWTNIGIGEVRGDFTIGLPSIFDSSRGSGLNVSEITLNAGKLKELIALPTWKLVGV